MKKEINDKMADELEAFTVDYPSEEEMDQTISALHAYVPEKNMPMSNLLEKMKDLLFLSGKEFFTISRLFWSANIIFLLFGILSTTLFHADPYLTLFVLTPLPFLTGLLEIFKSRDQGMAELEATFKYSVQQLIFSRVLIVSVFNLILNAILITWLYVALDTPFVFSWLFVYWMMPLTLLAALGLVLTTTYKGTITSPVLVISWLITGFLIAQIPNGADFINHIGLTGSISIVIVSLCTIIFQLRKIQQRRLSIAFNG
ncbi:hypothetical protein KFZ56_06055 [Virgibacillus sp. NKC19-3]|uniref:hypothetical protein n=1 Tax=Virgibacillus saliphilus TaxID=2831674 RepID=UPI001C9B8432|nr:hypothetical protein [Virgibacillus sp. NKC19-3]MBY7142647.1 hypothetical protein [Virgibacillus sp. NKC19-3]